MELAASLALLGLFSEMIETPRCICAVPAEDLLVPLDFPTILVTARMGELVREVLCFDR